MMPKPLTEAEAGRELGLNATKIVSHQMFRHRQRKILHKILAMVKLELRLSATVKFVEASRLQLVWVTLELLLS